MTTGRTNSIVPTTPSARPANASPRPDQRPGWASISLTQVTPRYNATGPRNGRAIPMSPTMRARTLIGCRLDDVTAAGAVEVMGRSVARFGGDAIERRFERLPTWAGPGHLGRLLRLSQNLAGSSHRPCSGAEEPAGVAWSRADGVHHAVTRSALDAVRRWAESEAEGRRHEGEVRGQLYGAYCRCSPQRVHRGGGRKPCGAEALATQAGVEGAALTRLSRPRCLR